MTVKTILIIIGVLTGLILVVGIGYLLYENMKK